MQKDSKKFTQESKHPRDYKSAFVLPLPFTTTMDTENRYSRIDNLQSPLTSEQHRILQSILLKQTSLDIQYTSDLLVTSAYKITEEEEKLLHHAGENFCKHAHVLLLKPNEKHEITSSCLVHLMSMKFNPIVRESSDPSQYIYHFKIISTHSSPEMTAYCRQLFKSIDCNIHYDTQVI